MVGVTTAQLINTGPAGPSFRQDPAGLGAAVDPTAGAVAGATPGNPWGPKAYGMGLNNPWALPPNPFLMRRALALINSVPGALVVSEIAVNALVYNSWHHSAKTKKLII